MTTETVVENKVVIEQVSNGVILTDNDGVREAFVVNEIDSQLGSTAVQELLYAALEHLGYIGSRYHQYRVQVRIEHGDKYECDSPSCQICHPLAIDPQNKV